MYAIVDIETTGGYAQFHRITEVAVILHDGVQIVEEYRTLINPGRNIPHFITGLTGITHNMVAEAPAFEEVAEDLYQLLEGKIFVAHNAYFDYSFLKREFEIAGLRWQAKKLCTVRLSRKIIPGLRSYSLGSIAGSLGIEIRDRHRAGGDATATAQIFERLLRYDRDNYIGKALKRNSGETILPPNLSKEEFDKLPAKPGVYYFLNARREVIYVGKANSIKKRIAGHFTGDAREWSRSRIRSEIHHIRFELTGNELVALVLESLEIRKLWPKYNQAQKYRLEEWGVYSYDDRNQYTRFCVNLIGRGPRPLVRFGSKGAAWNFMWARVHEFELCPKLSGLQISRDQCFGVQSGSCRGACAMMEAPEEYNKRAAAAITSFSANPVDAAIVGKGRKNGERSFLLVEKGLFAGFGFVRRKHDLTDFNALKQLVQRQGETPTVQHLVNACLVNPNGTTIITF